jgi:hypothetical protein
MRSKQYAKACKREIQKPVHGDNLPGHAEQGRSFDVEPRANLRNLREDFRAQDKPSNLSKCIKAQVWQRKERRKHAPQQYNRYTRTRQVSPLLGYRAEGKPAQPAQVLSSTRQTLKSFQMHESTNMAAQGAP